MYPYFSNNNRNSNMDQSFNEYEAQYENFYKENDYDELSAQNIPPYPNPAEPYTMENMANPDMNLHKYPDVPYEPGIPYDFNKLIPPYHGGDDFMPGRNPGFPPPEHDRRRPDYDRHRPDYDKPRPDYDKPRPGHDRPRPDYGRPGREHDKHRREHHMPHGRPPGHIPAKNEAEVLRAIDPGIMRRCIGKYAYVWMKSGQNFWMYVTEIGYRSVSGYRWTNFGWVYAGFDLRHVESFYCMP